MKIGVVSDIHGNGSALKAILADMGPMDLYIGLGDYLYPTASSWSIVDWMQEQEDRTKGLFIRGDNDLLADLPHFIDWWQSDPEDLFKYLDQLPTELRPTFAGHRFLLLHGYPTHPHFATPPEVPRPLAPERNLVFLRRTYLERFVDLSDVDFFLWGDYHLPYVEVHDDVVLINPGTAGWAMDQDVTTVSYVILEIAEDEVVIDHRRVPINLDTIIADLAQEYRRGPVEQSGKVKAFKGQAPFHSKEWKTHWGRIHIRKLANGAYVGPEVLWPLVDQTPSPSWHDVGFDNQ